jgi:hypothetical protein
MRPYETTVVLHASAVPEVYDKAAAIVEVSGDFPDAVYGNLNRSFLGAKVTAFRHQ